MIMEKDRLENLLNELPERTTETVRPGLAEDIKGTIPADLSRHRGGLDTIRIMIDLRVNRLAAAAVIIAVMLLGITFWPDGASSSDSVYQDGKLLVKYLLKGEMAAGKNMLADLPGSSDFFQDGREVVYYGGNVEKKDKDALMMHWKISEDSYRVIYGDFRTEVVTASELIRLQATMLQRRAK